MTFFLVELFRSYRPGKPHATRKSPKLRNSDGDGAWRECLDRDIYGANTPDYSHQVRRPPSRQHSAEQPGQHRQ